MDYMEEVKIIFDDTHYFDFLIMRNWPRTFRQFIDDRRAELLAKKDELYKEMSKEIDDVFKKIKGFRSTINEVLVQGLKDKMDDVPDSADDDISLGDDDDDDDAEIEVP